MSSEPATSVDAYLAALPADRRDAIARVRDVVNANLPAGYEEGIQYGMISWYIPRARYPQTYNGQPLAVASLGAQKSHMALYLMSVYGDPALDTWFRAQFARAGKKLDMGKSCVRFKTLDALPLEVIGETMTKVTPEAFIARYEAVKGPPKSAAKPAKAAAKPAKPKPTATAKATPKAKAARPAARR